MELYPAEVDTLGRLVEEWALHDDRELEATFKNASDTTTFLAVAQRLRAKGYTALPQEDKMNIITPQQVRFTLTGMAAIEAYCRDDTLEGKAFEAMTKQRAGVESNLDIDSYGVRIKVRRENPLEKNDPAVRDIINNWLGQRKAFRILRRWTFIGKGARFDLSMIRSTPHTAKGDFVWQSRFQPDKGQANKGQADITKQPAFYEIEVELLRPSDVPASEEERAKVVKECVKDLIRGVGEVLRGIQKHHLLIRNKVAATAMDGYKELTKTDRFRGVAPITMIVQNMRKEKTQGEPNIRDGYNVTDKADGLRMMGYVNSEGELFMIDMSMYVYKTGLIRLSCANSLVDGEYVTKDKDGRAIYQFMLFDCYISPDKRDITKLPFMGTGDDRREGGRYGELMSWIEKWNEGDGPIVMKGAGITPATKIVVSVKQFKFANAGDLSIFQLCARTLDSSFASIYNTDGLILTPNLLPLPEKPGVKFAEQLKWKPAEDNSVDFLVVFDKDSDTKLDSVNTAAKPGTGETVQHKTIRLYVGSDLDPAYEDPRGTVLYEQPLPGMRTMQKGRRIREYKPVLFNPRELPDTMANVAYSEIITSASGEDYVVCENGDPIENNSIIEMRYEPGNEPGWRWVPMRVRYDKTERFQKGIIGRTLNKDEAAEGVWNSIHDPITYHMIRTGSEQPSVKEVSEMSGAVAGVASGEVSKVYYERKGPKEDLQIVRGLRDFHRRYIKEDLLLRCGLSGGGKSLVDLACGQGGDLWSWVKWKADFVYGTDIAGNGIRDPHDGAYRRYVNAVMKFGGYDKIAKMVFTIGSSAKNLASGESGATPEESNIMRAVLGKIAPDGPVPPFVEKYAKNRLRNGANCVAVMFAIHYFFENEVSLTGFIRNVNDSLAMDGLFIGCCFDGRRVFEALRGIPQGGSLVGQEGGSEIWKITKRYSAEDLINGPEGLGLAIDVDFVSIGTTQTEYLVSFDLLKDKMAEIGCELLNADECKGLGLTNGSSLFEETYNLAAKKGVKFAMSPTVRQYSFFNRWFIFKRRRGGQLDIDEVSSTEVPAGLGSAREIPAGLGAAREIPAGLGASASENMGQDYALSPRPEALEKDKTPSKNAVTKQKANIALPSEPSGTQGASSSALGASASPQGASAADAGESLGDKKLMKTIPGAPENRKYKLSELFQFNFDSDLSDKLKIGKPSAARWLSLSAPVPILDGEVEYPTVEHYIAGMKYKTATNKPELAARLFSKEGEVHQTFLRKKAIESPLSPEREQDFLKEERKMVLTESDVVSKGGMSKYGAKFDEGKWLSVKDSVLRDALAQRWKKDEMLRQIIEAVRSKGLLLLYSGVGTGNDLGAKRTSAGIIEGENKVGKILMELAGFR